VRADLRPERPEPPDVSAHRSHALGPIVLLRLFYILNPMLPCRAAAMATGWVADIPALLRFLERIAGTAGENVIDIQMSAFIAAHADRKSEMQVNNLASAKTADLYRHGELALLRDLQTRYHPNPMPALAKWAAARLRPGLDRWRNKPRRQALQARLDVVAQAGFLARLIELTDDPGARAIDLAGALQAELELRAIDAEVSAIDGEDRLRLADAERFGQAITGGIGLAALILTVLSVLLR
jgi:eukaryotic-like serine/threonine-protein kinase